MSPLQKDALTYVGAGVAGAVLAHSFQAKLLGVLIGGSGGLALAAWWLSRPHAQAAGERPPHNPHGWTPRDPGPGWWDHYTQPRYSGYDHL